MVQMTPMTQMVQMTPMTQMTSMVQTKVLESKAALVSRRRMAQKVT